MSLIFIWLIIFVLYLRTIKYSYVIDDSVKRDGYMYDVPVTGPSPDFFDTRPSVMYRIFVISMHAVNASIIYLLWGFLPSLIFAVHPMCVWGTAWITGNYYATATYFVLIAYYILHTFPNVFGALIAMPIYAAALNSTICPIMFPFLFIFTGPAWGLSMFFPLVMYLRGKRFTTGIKIRYNINNDKVIRTGEVKVNYLRRFALMTKVIARYTYDCLVPNSLGFFSLFGHRIKEQKEVWNYYHSFNKEFWISFALCLSVFVTGIFINPFGILWYFVFISIHSQFNLTGQFYAQRYAYLSIIGLCIVVGTFLQPYPILSAILITFLVIRTHLFIPAWKNMGRIWLNDMETYPDYPLSYNNLAQYYLQKPQLPNYLLNYAGYLLFKGEMIEPNAWELKMNIAAWYAKLGILDQCLDATQKSVSILEPLGGEPTMLKLLKQQIIDLTAAQEKLKKEEKNATNNATTQTDGTRTQSVQEVVSV